MQEADRVRRHTARSVLSRIDDATASQLLEVAEHPERASQRLVELEREWDLDRTIEAEAAATGLAGLALGVFVHPRFLLLPAVVGTALFMYATTGRYPLLPILRRLGVRTAREIQRERYAVKAIRGDFSQLSPLETAEAQPLKGEPLWHH